MILQKTKTPIIVVKEHSFILFYLNIKLRAAVRLDNHANNDTYVIS